MKVSGISGIILILMGAFTGDLQASWKTDSFLGSIQRSGSQYSFEFWNRGLSSVSDVDFRSDSTAKFLPFWNKMVLEKSHDDGAERIHAWHRLSTTDLGTLAHESFHAYVHNFILRHPAWSHERAWLEKRAPVVFYDIHPSKTFVALEEAYASFIGNIVTSARSIDVIMSKSTPNCVGRERVVRNIWSQIWKEKIQGYYYRDSFTEYWEDRAQWALDKMRGQESEVEFGEAIFTESSISQADRQWISLVLFEGRWSENFDQSFPHHVAAFEACKN